MKRYRVVAPSNIALIKYWGKRDNASQWPANDSLSMTLANAVTTTTARTLSLQAHEVFVGEHQLFSSDPFAKKIFAHLKLLGKEFGFSKGLRIDTKNSFPSSCGIASSASGFAALTLAAIAAWTESSSLEELSDRGFHMQKLVHFSRLGSGSACRSLFGGFVHWQAGSSPSLQSVEQIASADHWALDDLIVITSNKRKATSSSAGHDHAPSSPLFIPRVAVIPERIKMLKRAIAERDINTLGTLVETDALDMHAVMMSATSPINYFNDVTGKLFAWVRNQRLNNGWQVYATLDAGPNPHLLCARECAEQVASAVAQEFPQCEILRDTVGRGPSLFADDA